MSFLIHSCFMVGFLWMTLHFWRQLPRHESVTDAARIREFLEWAGKGVAVPVFVWYAINVGLSAWLPPFLSRVDYVKKEAAMNGVPWFWPAVGVCSPAMSVIASYWSAFSLLGMLWMIRAHIHDRHDFNTSMLIWSIFLLPVCVAVLLIGGWGAAGLGLVLWLAPVVQATLPSAFVAKRSPSYSQAIAKIKFGKYSEAEWEVIRELEQCENDFHGWMMLAELYAVHFGDFKQAEQTVIDLCEQPDITPSDACVALHRLADWYLELQNDPQGARRCMEAISQRYPGTHLDKMARLRRNRIPSTAEEWIEANRNKPLPLPSVHDGLEETDEVDVGNLEGTRQRAKLLSQDLLRDPNDVTVREEFARAMARLGDFQAAIDQVNLLLEMQGQLTTRRAEWMGFKARWLHKLTPGSPEVLNLLRQIIADFPHSAQAVAAQCRILQLGEQGRVARYGGRKKGLRIHIRLGEGQNPRAEGGAGRG